MKDLIDWHIDSAPTHVLGWEKADFILLLFLVFQSTQYVLHIKSIPFYTRHE